MPLHFRNITATPDDPVREWGFEGMLAAIDRGYAVHWSRMAAAIAAEPALEQVFDEAADAAESTATVKLIRLKIAHARRSAREVAVDRLRNAYRTTGLTQKDLAEKLGTSRSRLNTYLTGAVTPAMDVLVSIERLAEDEYALRNVRDLVVR